MKGYIMEILFGLIVILIIVSVLIRKSHYHKHDEEVHEQIENNYGTPQKSLFLSTALLSIHQATEITDENENVVYSSKSKFLTLHDRTIVTDASGNEVSTFHKKIFTLHQRHYVTMASGKEFELSNEFFHLIKDITDIEGLGWKIEGNILALNFTLKDESENLIAYIGQKVLSIHDKYSIDIYDISKEKEVITIVLVLQHMLRDRQNASRSSSSASANSAH